MSSAVNRANVASLNSPALVVLLGLRLVLLLAGGALLATLFSATAVEHAGTWSALGMNVVVIVVDLITLVVLARVLKREGRSLAGLFGRFRARDAAVGLGLGVVVVVAFVVATFLANLAVYQGPPPVVAPEAGFRVPLWFGLWCLLPMPVTIALAEEALYRGYLQPLWGARLGAWPGLLLVAVAFGLQHLAFALSTPQAAASRIVATFLVGVLVGVLFRKLGRLWPLVIAHWLLDVLGLGLPLLLASLAG